MSRNIPIRIDDTSMEILARICKATAEQYDCSMSINFQDGQREVRFIGDESIKPYIFEEVQNIFRK